MTDGLRIGVLGQGSIGLRHARNLLALGCQVHGFDPSPERLQLLQNEGGVPCSSAHELVARSQAVVIATPNERHKSDLEYCLNAGISVFIEKPIAVDQSGLRELLETAQRKGLLVFVGHNLRFHPTVIAARQIIGSRLLGRVLWATFCASMYLPSFRPWQDHRKGYASNPSTGGVIFDDIHEFDLAWHLLGPAQVAAAVAISSGEVGIQADDIADIVLTHENGAQSTLHLDFVSQNRQRFFHIVGSEGSLRVDLDARRLLHTASGGSIVKDETYQGSYAEDYVSEISCFVDCLRGITLPPCSGEDALQVLTLLTQSRLSARLPQK